MIEILTDIVQGTDEWHRCRLGMPTASNFETVCAKVGPRGGTSHKEYIGRITYMRKLAGEILTGEPMVDTYKNADMQRATEREAEACDLYALLKDVEPVQVGFIKNGNCGASPDRLINADGGLEVKDALPHVQIERLESGVIPPNHRPQIIGNIMVSERDWWDFMSHCRNLPPLIIRVHRDEKEIAEMRDAVNRFVDELDLLVRRVRAMQ